MTERKALWLVLAAFTMVVLGSRKISHEHKRVRFGYELNKARQELRVLSKNNRSLRLEYSMLVSPERIGGLAHSLGMRPPEPGQIRVIKGGSAHTAQTPTGAAKP